MNIKRYTIAASLSLAAHSIVLFVAHEPKAFAMPVGSQSTSVSLNFKAIAAPVKTETVLDPKKADTPAQSQTFAPTATDQVVKKSPPIKTQKRENNTPNQPKLAPQQTKAQARTKMATPSEKTELQKPQVDKKQPEKATNQVANRGVTAEPVMIENPSFLSRPRAPQYPRMARKRGIEGVALYEIWLDKNGHQVKQVLISSSGATLLDKSALEAIKDWKFSPHSVDGQTMAHRVQIPIRFKLDR